jgi:hypothetical protein
MVQSHDRVKGIQTDFAELLRRRRSSGRRLSMLRLGWSCSCSRCLLLLLFLPVMVLVLRGALARLSGVGLRRSCRSSGGRGALRLSGGRSLRRRGGCGLSGVLCKYRQRQCKHDERPEDNSKSLLGFHSILCAAEVHG